MTGLNSQLAEKVDGSYIVLLEQTSQKLGRVTNAKVKDITMTTYQSKDSAIGVRFVACALVSN